MGGVTGDGTGWRPLRIPAGEVNRAFTTSAFAKLARVHFLSFAGDALVAIALASSLFFSVDPSAARWRILLYLLLTIAPFAVVAPLIGPAMDRARGGHRLMIVGTALTRSIVAFLMIGPLAADSLLVFPEAFVMLVMNKSYQVAKSAVVPTTVSNDSELVEANSKLQLLSAIAGFAGAIPGGILMLFGPAWVIGFAGFVFAATMVAALTLPSTQVAAEPAGDAEKAELRGGGVILASSAMGVLRGVVGFSTFLLAFALRGDTPVPEFGASAGKFVGAAVPWLIEEVPEPVPGPPPAWHLGVVLALSVVGGLIGASLAPRLRRVMREENILIGSLVVAAGAGVLAAFTAGLGGMSLLALAVGVTATAGKQAFDSIVQRDAPDANYGRSFARFEARFQLIWVLGALIPVALDIPPQIGGVVVAGAAGFAAVSYLLGLRTLQGEDPGPRWLFGRLPLRPRYQGGPRLVPPADPPADTTAGRPPPGPIQKSVSLFSSLWRVGSSTHARGPAVTPPVPDTSSKSRRRRGRTGPAPPQPPPPPRQPPSPQGRPRSPRPPAHGPPVVPESWLYDQPERGQETLPLDGMGGGSGLDPPAPTVEQPDPGDDEVGDPDQLDLWAERPDP
ncbi:MAG: hypothetical protein JJLCMIEE_02760 [Acidimicrobiales bacterium]|nr:MAG: hypothetical protein EDR02_14665 [Actinomycetota bacterium]MBV6509664.1 hypothetical protein [Acidimicrobiales bacterium]RIK06354.1 MAG: hypothetical protein DCC48_07990 [Acidobacteriota bacterium]